MLSDEKLKVIKERAEKATPGPWVVGTDQDRGYAYKDYDHVWCWEVPENGSPRTSAFIEIDDEEDYTQTGPGFAWDTDCACDGYGLTKQDAEFCANAREDIPLLLEEIERLKEAERLLSALQAAGVDNWDGYDYALESIREDE